VAAVEAGLAGLADPQTKLRAARIISSFENSTTDIRYDYAEDIGDGRGITAGRAGFTSGTGDLLEVVRRFAQQRSDSALAGYLPALEADNGTDSTAGLDGFTDVWAQTSHTDPLLAQIQDQVSDELYFDPAVRRAQQVGVRSALGQLIIWDTLVQHGEGDDPDGLPAIQNEVVVRFGTVAGNEPAWLTDFLEVRRAHLLHAADPNTRDAWRDSVSRVDALESLVHARDLDLRPPLAWDVYGDHYTLDG
jgi:chitosanase